jgi:hypothetical protein
MSRPLPTHPKTAAQTQRPGKVQATSIKRVDQSAMHGAKLVKVAQGYFGRRNLK